MTEYLSIQQMTENHQSRPSLLNQATDFNYQTVSGVELLEPGASARSTESTHSQVPKLTCTAFLFVYASSPASPSSRPIPDCLTPPNGIL